MSTPSVTILKNLVLNWKSNQMEEETIATFYRHYDGYPSCHAIDIANSLVVASRTKPEQHIDFSGASVERNILNNRNWCQHFLKRDNRGCNQPTAKKVRCAETGNQFVSLSDAARAVGLRNGNSIRRAIDRGGTAGGYHWEYLDEKKR